MGEKVLISPDTISMTDNGVRAMHVSFEEAFEEQAVTYARIMCLKHNGEANGTLFVTCDQHSWVDGEQVWPIHKSTDGGQTWSHVSDVRDETFGTNRKAQPMLFELPQDVGMLKAGTLLLTGNLVPDDNSSSRLVIYKSIDLGETWSCLSTVDSGGVFAYDPSPESTTSTVWEPFLYIDGYGHLVCAYSDERQKKDDVLQALCLRYTSDGEHWSELINLAAIGNKSDRPGMVTVAKLPDGRYIAAYEVVNRPSLAQNSSVVYYKFSDDGLEWHPEQLGTLLLTADGLGLGSSPYVVWADNGTANGVIVAGAKWAIDKNGDIDDGGRNFFVNDNLGQGPWQSVPQPLRWDGKDIRYLDAFSQGLATSVDGSVVYQAANIVQPDKSGIDVRFGVMPVKAMKLDNKR